eukprot:435387-Hanusia_phi.AAC.1
MAGQGSSAKLIVSVSVSVGSISQAFSYNHVSLSSAHNTNGPCTGSTRISVAGAAFGVSNFSPKMGVKPSTSLYTKWSSQTSIVVRMTSGISFSRSICVSLLRTVHTSTVFLSYSSPDLTGVLPRNVLIENKGFFTIFGRFAIDAQSPSHRLDATSGQKTRWTSYSAIQCSSVKGFGRSRMLVISISLKVASLTETLTYDKGILSLISPSNLRSGEIQNLDIFGKLFTELPRSHQIRVSYSSCSASDWVSDSSLHCKLSFGAVGSQPIIVTTGSSVSTLTQIVSFDVPVLTSFSLKNVAWHAQMKMLYVQSESMIAKEASVAFRVGFSPCETTTWASDSVIGVRIAQGVGKTHAFVYTIGLLLSTATELITYDGYSVRKVYNSSNIPPRAETSFYIETSLGDMENTFKVRIQGTVSAISQWNSVSSILCSAVSGTRHSIGVRLTISTDVETLSQSISFDIPAISNVRVRNTTYFRDTASPFTLYGLNFGTYDTSCMSSISGTTVEQTIWTSDTSLACMYGQFSDPSLAATKYLVATVGVKAATFTESITYDSIHLAISSISRSNIPTTGARSVTLYSTSFSRRDATLKWYTRKIKRGYNLRHLTGFLNHQFVPELEVGSQVRDLGVGLLEIVNNGSHYIDGSLGTIGGGGYGFFGLFIVEPVTAGRNYIPGDIIVSGGGGTGDLLWRQFRSSNSCLPGAIARFQVDGLGSVKRSLLLIFSAYDKVFDFSYVFITPDEHGDGYSSDDTSVALVFHATNHSQDTAITWIQIELSGLYYVNGWITATATQGSGMFGSFDVNSAGEFQEIYISPIEHGSGYRDSVHLNVLYAGTNISQTNSITAIEIQNGGINFLPGQLKLTSTSGEGFLANFSVYPNGSIQRIEILYSDHGSNYLEDPISVDVCYQSTINISGDCYLQNGTITQVDILEKGFQRNTSSCRVNSIIVAVGGGGFGFRAIISETLNGQIRSVNITNHGFGYQSTPSIAVNDAECLCNLEAGDIPGGMDGCIKAILATGGRLDARRADGAKLFPRRAQNVSLRAHIGGGANLTTRIARFGDVKAQRSTQRWSNSPTTGSVLMTVAGSNYGLSTFSSKLRFSFTLSESTTWISDTSIHAGCSQSVSRTATIQITTATKLGTISEMHTVDLPRMSSFVQSNTPMTGSAKFLLLGSSLSILDSTFRFRIFPSIAESTNWISDTSGKALSCTGVFASILMIVTVNQATNSISEAFSINNVQISTVKTGSNSAGMTGSNLITIQGTLTTQTGSSTLKARIQFTACESTEWLATTALICRAHAGTLRTNSIIATIATKQSNTATEAWTSSGTPIMSVGRGTNKGGGGTGSTSVT